VKNTQHPGLYWKPKGEALLKIKAFTLRLGRLKYLPVKARVRASCPQTRRAGEAGGLRRSAAARAAQPLIKLAISSPR